MSIVRNAFCEQIGVVCGVLLKFPGDVNEKEKLEQINIVFVKPTRLKVSDTNKVTLSSTGKTWNRVHCTHTGWPRKNATPTITNFKEIRD